MKDANDLLVAGMDISDVPSISIDMYCAEQVLARYPDDQPQQYKAMQKFITTVNNELIKSDIAVMVANVWNKDVTDVRKQFAIYVESEDEKINDFADIYSCFSALDESVRAEEFGVGFPNIDENVQLRKKWVALLGAYSFGGKSSSLIDFIIHWVVRERKRVLFFSLEMPKEDVIEIIIGKIVGVPQWKVRNAISADTYRQVAEKIGKYLYIIDKNNLSIDEINEYIQIANNRVFDKPVDVVAVDYFSYLSRVDDTKEEAKTAKKMKAIAKEKNVLFFMLAQFNKQSQFGDRGAKTAKEPMPTDLKGAMELYASCDVAYFIWRPVLMQQMGEIEREKWKYITLLKIAKIRGGLRKGVSHFTLHYNPETGRLSESGNV